MGAGDPVELRFKGLKELDRALGKADKTLRKELRNRLKDAADIVATEAREIAAAKGLRKSGDLIRGIRPYAASGRAGVRSSATHGGYNYPRRLEYEQGKPTLGPALDAKADEVIRSAEGLVDDIADDFNRGMA